MAEESTGRPVINTFAAESAVGHTVTVKLGAGFEVPWDVVRGTAPEVRQQLAEAMGIDPVAAASVPLYDLIAAAGVRAAEAQRFAVANHGRIAGIDGPVADVAVAVTTPQSVETEASTSASKSASKPAAKRASKPASKAASKPASSATSAAFAAAAETPAADEAPATAAPQSDPPFETDPILVALEEAKTKEQLGAIWKANALAFKNRPEVQAAAKAAAERIG